MIENAVQLVTEIGIKFNILQVKGNQYQPNQIESICAKVWFHSSAGEKRTRPIPFDVSFVSHFFEESINRNRNQNWEKRKWILSWTQCTLLFLLSLKNTYKIKKKNHAWNIWLSQLWRVWTINTFASIENFCLNGEVYRKLDLHYNPL